MKIRWLFIFILTSFSSIAQITISGTVNDSNGPLEYVNVYINNSMVGTTSNAKGEFEITVKEGQHQLIISYLGYKKINYKLNTTTYKNPLIFTLLEDRNILDEVIIEKTIYDKEWYYNLSVFKKEFIGFTKLSKDCKILNPKILQFDFDKRQKILIASAREPLQIEHRGLGYLIVFELESFVKQNNSVTYVGYTRYQPLEGSDNEQKMWKKNRLKAYNGSIRHFFKSAIDNTLDKEGFTVHQFKRVSHSNGQSNVEKPQKFTDYLYRSNIKTRDIINKKNNIIHLKFEDNLIIVYAKEKEEAGYLKMGKSSTKRQPLPQTSSIIPLAKNIILKPSGVLLNPLDVSYEGYWSYEKLGDALPLDYNP
ncbi:carboxypeptidase-like regulatory domain-containing protein [Olleya sp. YS]|uniref:carboxypeptidase-like regulatory domain-containing protein n=1 Tax=Olleya sp. YS TaxID=3028318 RepID=UPI0024342337|nr:carboxypeptidase-like regulatory domain-containing protein [Olleya sp. YS]WGD33738.1 carboxypeptidase-like regulatory domain-containing protein [Olleya sp. YS]